MSSQDTPYCKTGATWRNVHHMIKTAESIGRDEARLQFDAEVGERINTLRRRANIKQRELATAIGVTEGTMSGKISAGPWYGYELDVIAAKLNTTLDVLYGKVDMPPAPITSIVGRRRRNVGSVGLDPTTSSVESREFAGVVLPFARRGA